jgi:hypothetical protein
MTEQSRGTQLTAPRAQVDHDLLRQVERGQQLQSRTIRDPSDYENARNEYKSWDAFNQQFLRERFSSLDVYHQYKSTYSKTWPPRAEFQTLKDDYRKRIAAKTAILESIREQLSLFVEPSHDVWRETARAPSIDAQSRTESIRLNSEPTAFLLMPFDTALDWLRDLITEAGKETGVRIMRADDIFAGGVIIDQVKEQIRRSDAVIGVCAGRNANVFYELGIAEEQHRPILIAESSGDLPFDIQHFRAHFYGGDTPSNSKQTLLARIAKALRGTIEARYSASHNATIRPSAPHAKAEPPELQDDPSRQSGTASPRGDLGLLKIPGPTNLAEPRFVQFRTANRAAHHESTGGHPQALRFLFPMTATVRETDLPMELPCDGGTIIIKRFTDSGFAFEEQGTAGVEVRAEVYLVSPEAGEQVPPIRAVKGPPQVGFSTKSNAPQRFIDTELTPRAIRFVKPSRGEPIEREQLPKMLTFEEGSLLIKAFQNGGVLLEELLPSGIEMRFEVYW